MKPLYTREMVGGGTKRKKTSTHRQTLPWLLEIRKFLLSASDDLGEKNKKKYSKLVVGLASYI